MNKISAVICELNPLHDGHKYIFNKARENSDVLIAVMSGNFVQRGTPAVYDKYSRAECAINAGADLVLELPFPFSSSSAEYFARAGVSIASAVDATDLWFGSESGDEKMLKAASEKLKYIDFKSSDRAAEKREEYLKSELPDIPESILSSPNDILAVEYMKYNSVKHHAVERIKTESASDIRRTLNADYDEKLTKIEFHHFRTLRRSPENIFGANGGVCGRLYNSAFLTNDPSKWLTLAATKQYTNSRLRRTALMSVCGISEEDINSTPQFTTLLGANEKGRAYLSSIRYTCRIYIVTNPSDRYKMSDEVVRQYENSEFADKLYTLISGFDDIGYFARKSPHISI